MRATYFRKAELCEDLRHGSCVSHEHSELLFGDSVGGSSRSTPQEVRRIQPRVANARRDLAMVAAIGREPEATDHVRDRLRARYQWSEQLARVFERHARQ